MKFLVVAAALAALVTSTSALAKNGGGGSGRSGPGMSMSHSGPGSGMNRPADGGISTVVDGGITELDPAGDRLLVDISGFADEWLHPLSRPKSRRVNRKGPRNSGARFPPLACIHQ